MKAQRQHEWTKFLKFFSEQNAGRPTRIGVFQCDGDKVSDYWLEDGLPLMGIDIDTKGERPSLQIIVGNFTHEVKDAVKLVFKFGVESDEDGIDISNDSGQTTILRFESEAA